MTSEPNPSDTAKDQESKHSCGFYCLDSDGEANCLNFCDEKGVLRQVPKGVCNHHNCSEYVYTIEEFAKTFESDKCKFTETRLCTIKGMNCDDCPHVRFNAPITSFEEFQKTFEPSEKCGFTKSGECTVKNIKSCFECPHHPREPLSSKRGV
jgi:hypothetical protein